MFITLNSPGNAPAFSELEHFAVFKRHNIAIITNIISPPEGSITNSKPNNFICTMSAEITKEEAEKAISQEADDDDFKDAVEEEEEEVDGCFPVSAEELSIIRAELACEFPEDYSYLSDAYILSVASKPYSKDPTVRRPLEVRLQSLGLRQ